MAPILLGALFRDIGTPVVPMQAISEAKVGASGIPPTSHSFHFLHFRFAVFRVSLDQSLCSGPLCLWHGLTCLWQRQYGAQDLNDWAQVSKLSIADDVSCLIARGGKLMVHWYSVRCCSGGVKSWCGPMHSP